MPKYSVLLTRDVTESVSVDIEADRPEDAERLAIEKPQAEMADLKWELDDCANADPYVTNCEEADEGLEPE